MDGVSSPADDWWTTELVAEWCEVTPGTIRAYVARGQMPEPERIGRTLVWRPEVIRRWRPGGGRRDHENS